MKEALILRNKSEQKGIVRTHCIKQCDNYEAPWPDLSNEGVKAVFTKEGFHGEIKSCEPTQLGKHLTARSPIGGLGTMGA